MRSGDPGRRARPRPGGRAAVRRARPGRPRQAGRPLRACPFRAGRDRLPGGRSRRRLLRGARRHVQRLRRRAGHGRGPSARDTGTGLDVRRHRPALESTPLDDRASRRGGRGAPARAGALSRARRAGARRGARDRGDAQRARVARERSRRAHGRDPRGGAVGRRRRPGRRRGGGCARRRGHGSPSRTGGGGRARPRDPRPHVADPAARGAHAGGLVCARHARRDGAGARVGARCRRDSSRSRRSRSGHSPASLPRGSAWPGSPRRAGCSSWRCSASAEPWPRPGSCTGSRWRSSRGRAAGSAARPPRSRWRAWRSGRRCRTRPAASPCSRRRSRS